MTIIQPEMPQICRHCGASAGSAEKKCWLCNSRENTVNPYASNAVSETPESEDSPTRSGWESTSDRIFGVLLILCLVLTIVIGIGFAVQDIGLLIPYGICVGPALGITLIRMLISQGKKKKTKPSRLFLTFAVSLASTIVIVFLLAVAAVIALFVICISSFPIQH